MTSKVDLLYPFDKGFFGKSLYTATKENLKALKPSKLKMDSVDDLVSYFDNKLFRQNRLERSPKTDIIKVHTQIAPTTTLNNFWGY